MTMHKVAPGVYKDELGDFHVDEMELQGSHGTGYDGGDDFEGSDVGDDVADTIDEMLDGIGDDDDPDAYEGLGDAIGRIKNPRRRKKARGRYERKMQRLRDRARKRGINVGGGRKKREEPEVEKQATAENASHTLSEAGTFSATVIPQYDFTIEEVTFSAPSGTKVTEIKAGDRVLWSSSSGIPMSIWASTSYRKGMLKGAKCKAGLTIRVTFSATASSGDVDCVFQGWKPAGSC